MYPNRTKKINTILSAALNPSHLLIQDDSQKHSGHPGASEGGGHFKIEINSPHFAGKSLIDCHRLIYQALGDMLPNEIHALQISIK